MILSLRAGLEILTVVMAVASAGIFVWRILGIVRVMRQARPTDRFDNLGQRFTFMMGQVFAHKRMLRLKLSGTLHAFIFSGFIVLLLDVVNTLGQVFIKGFALPPITGTIVDIWVLLVLIGIALAVYQRLVIKPERYHGSDEADGFFILGMIGAIVIGIIIHASFYRFVAPGVFGVKNPVTPFDFLSYNLGTVWKGLGWNTPSAASVGYTIGYIMDIGVIFIFLAYLPFSKHLHVFTAIPNIFVHKTRPHGELVPEVVEDGSIAVRTFEDLNWKDVLDLFTCTECGRCQAVCPAHAAGQPLSPKMVIIELRDALKDQMAGKPRINEQGEPLQLAEIVSPEALWSCTTCGACMEACPVYIEHVPKIVGMRSALLEEGDVDKSAQKALLAWDRQGNSFGQPARKRPQWAKGLDFTIKDARKEPVDWLWFVGDFASYDPRMQELTQLVARLLNRAGVDFGILYEGEANSGNDALRIGEYGLFESLAQKNLKALEKAEFNRVFTTDPHSLNALRNEYVKFGFDKPVLHYTQMFLDLIDKGQLAVTPLDMTVTYHDPCYLGRWNRIFDAPRDLMDRLGVTLKEMPRNRENSFCCGAGGGRIWMDETGVQERPSNNRIKEAITLEGVDHFVVACPKDVSMFSAAVSATGNEDKLTVIDMAELLARATGLVENKEKMATV